MWTIWLFMTIAVIVWGAVFFLVIRIISEIIWQKFRP
jgi:hypothetical protein